MTSRRHSNRRHSSNSTNSSNMSDAIVIPYRKIIVLGCILAANNTSIWMIFSFLPSMVKFFYPEMIDEELGYKSGYMGAAFSIGSLLGNFMWGMISDSIGRRPTLLYGLLGTAISSLCFGFSPNYNVAIFFRFMWGFLNGNIGVSKTYMSEILDDKNTPKGMALYGVIGGLGRAIGPILGGLLVFPQQASHSKNYILRYFPFCIPTIIISINCCIMFAIAYYELEETLVSSELRNSKKKQLIGKTDNSGNIIYTQLNNSDDLSEQLNSSEHGLLTAWKESDSSPSKTFVNDSNASPDAMSPEQDRSDNVANDDFIDLNSFTLSALKKSNSKSSLGGKRKNVSFSGLVMVKVIGSEALAYGKLKKIEKDDRPILNDDPKANLFGFVDNDMINDEDDERLSISSTVSLSTTSSSSIPEDNHSTNDSEELTSDDLEILDILGNNIQNSSILPRYIPRYSNGAEFNNYQSYTQSNIFHKVLYLISKREIFLTSFLYGGNAFLQVIFSEIYPLWVYLPRSEGGFGYDQSFIAFTAILTVPITAAIQTGFYPGLVQSYGLVKTSIYGLFLFAATVWFMPAISSLKIDSSTSDNEWYIFPLLTLGVVLVQISANWILISIFVLINNSCYSHQRGTVNGIGQTFASLGRAIGPVVGGFLFAWSETSGYPWPLDYSCTFYVLSLLAIVLMWFTCHLPRSIERKKREPKNPRYASSMMKNCIDEDSWEPMNATTSNMPSIPLDKMLNEQDTDDTKVKLLSSPPKQDSKEVELV